MLLIYLLFTHTPYIILYYIIGFKFLIIFLPTLLSFHQALKKVHQIEVILG